MRNLDPVVISLLSKIQDKDSRDEFLNSYIGATINKSYFEGDKPIQIEYDLTKSELSEDALKKHNKIAKRLIINEVEGITGRGIKLSVFDKIFKNRTKLIEAAKISETEEEKQSVNEAREDMLDAKKKVMELYLDSGLVAEGTIDKKIEEQIKQTVLGSKMYRGIENRFKHIEKHTKKEEIAKDQLKKFDPISEIGRIIKRKEKEISELDEEDRKAEIEDLKNMAKEVKDLKIQDKVKGGNLFERLMSKMGSQKTTTAKKLSSRTDFVQKATAKEKKNISEIIKKFASKENTRQNNSRQTESNQTRDNGDTDGRAK